MIVSCVFSRVKAVLLAVIAVLRRGFCCLSRRRKPSLTGCEVLSSVSVVQNDGNHSSRNKDFVSTTSLSFLYKTNRFPANR